MSDVTSASSSKRKQRVLVLDDHPIATRVLIKLLQKRHYLAAGENDPRKAIQVARAFRPDLILMDVSMPWMSGYEVADLLASDSGLAHVPIVFISADAMREDDSLKHGAPVLIKPFSVEDLM